MIAGSMESAFQEALEHPEGLLVPLDAFNHQILSFQVISLSGKITGANGVIDDFFMANNQGGDVILLRHGGFEVIHSRSFGEHSQAANGIGIQRANAFGDFIDGFKKVLVMFFKSFVKLEKARAFHVPMCQVGKRHQGVAVGENKIQAFNETIVFSRGRYVRFSSCRIHG